MVYFVSAIDPVKSCSGIEKRCNMWWNYWNLKHQNVKLVKLPEQWKIEDVNLIEKMLKERIGFSKLPKCWQLFEVFTGSSLKCRYSHIRILNTTIDSAKSEDIIFIFRGYNLYYYSIKRLNKILSKNHNIVIDYDESDYLSLNTFRDKDYKWNQIKETVRAYEMLIFNQQQLKIFVSGKNEVKKIAEYYQVKKLPIVFENKLLIETKFFRKQLTFPIKLLIIGTYSYPPNMQMLEIVISNVITQLKQPHLFEFFVVGRGLRPEFIKMLKKVKQIEFFGTITDDELIELYKEVHFNLAPLISGGGTKYKLIESLAFSTPIIASNEAVKGLKLKINEHYILFNSDSFENDLLNLSKSTKLYYQMQKQCHEQYTQNYKLKIDE